MQAIELKHTIKKINRQDTDWIKDSHSIYLTRFVPSLYNEFLHINIKKENYPQKTGKRFVQMFQKIRYTKINWHMKGYLSLLIKESELKYTSMTKIKNYQYQTIAKKWSR